MPAQSFRTDGEHAALCEADAVPVSSSHVRAKPVHSPCASVALAVPALLPPSPPSSGQSAQAAAATCAPWTGSSQLAEHRDCSTFSRRLACSSLAPAPPRCADGLSDEGPHGGPLQLLRGAGGAGGAAGACLEWRVECLQARLTSSCGSPLVSPTFALGGMPGLRLMFAPGAAWAARQVKGGRKLWAGRGASAGAEVPRHGALKLKALCAGHPASLSFYLTVGGRRQGPCHCDFSEHAIQGCDLECDWLRQMDREAGCLRLQLDFV